MEAMALFLEDVLVRLIGTIVVDVVLTYGSAFNDSIVSTSATAWYLPLRVCCVRHYLFH